MRLAIVAEKPSILAAALTSIRESFPDTDLSTVLVCYPVFGWFVGDRRFKLPRGLRWEDYPFVGSTMFKPIGLEEARCVLGADRATSRIATEVEAAESLSKADRILLLMDPDYGGLHLAARFLADHFDVIPWDRTVCPTFFDLLPTSIRQSMDEAVRGDEKMHLVHAGEIRRYFDYNYLVNSLAVISETARRVGIEKGVPSKYGLQLLYDARQTGEISYSRRIERMARWEGTGKYPRKAAYGLGSPASRAPIVDQLVKNGYLEIIGKTSTRLSTSGHRFLDALHPRCEDQDLPFRLAEWSRLSPANAEEKIARYIRSFFGRQKTFMAQQPGERALGLSPAPV